MVLVKEFHKEMIDIYINAKKECGNNATRYLHMVTTSNGVTVAKSFIQKNQPTDVFATLWELGRLDLTVEALILKPKYKDLFTEEERNIAKSRLEEYGCVFLGVKLLKGDYQLCQDILLMKLVN